MIQEKPYECLSVPTISTFV